MKASWVLLLASLCWGALAEEVGAEAACAAGGCAKRGGALLQKAPALNSASEPVSEDDAAGAADGDAADDGDEDEEEEEEQEALVDAGQKPCDKWKKSKVQKKVLKFEGKIKKFLNRTAKCQQRWAVRLAKQTKGLEHYKKCAGYGGPFVADGTSEDPEAEGIPDKEDLDAEAAELSESEDGLDEPEDADEAMEVEELNELVMETEDLDELADNEEQDELDEAKELNSQSSRIKPCDKVKDPMKHVGWKEAKVKKFSAKLANCTTRRAPKLDKLKKRLAHFTKCL